MIFEQNNKKYELYLDENLIMRGKEIVNEPISTEGTFGKYQYDFIHYSKTLKNDYLEYMPDGANENTPVVINIPSYSYIGKDISTVKEGACYLIAQNEGKLPIGLKSAVYVSVELTSFGGEPKHKETIAILVQNYINKGFKNIYLCGGSYGMAIACRVSEMSETKGLILINGDCEAEREILQDYQGRIYLTSGTNDFTNNFNMVSDWFLKLKEQGKDIEYMLVNGISHDVQHFNKYWTEEPDYENLVSPGTSTINFANWIYK